MTTISIIGSAGIPANYGGFETLAENLAAYHQKHGLPGRLCVYCSLPKCPSPPQTHLGAELRYVSLKANGVTSIPYDAISLFSAAINRADIILLLGVSGAVFLPLIRLISKAKIITNIDGIEWKRDKWNGFARRFLHLSEYMAVRFSHHVIADNQGIADHVAELYGRQAHVIPYGGDHASAALPLPWTGAKLPERYALALCRIEPENNVTMILEAFANQSGTPLVFIGNWNSSVFGRELKERFSHVPHIFIVDSIYDLGVLATIRGAASSYIHGHSAGGTNPSLVEIMHFGIPVLAYDCVFNRHTTDDKALFFKDRESLCEEVERLTPALSEKVGRDMREIARARYTWDIIGMAYFNFLLD